MSWSDPRYASEVLAPSSGRGRSDGAPLVAPLVQSTTFVRNAIGSNPAHQYSRVSNPTVEALERGLQDLADAPFALAFASGLAAETALFLALLESGDHVVLGRAIYGGTTRLFTKLLDRFGVRASFVDACDALALAKAIEPKTKLVVVETPANPTLELTDLALVRDLASGAGARLVVDNTFLTPYLQRPLDLGADVEILSTTKFIDGHSLALGGALLTRDAELAAKLKFVRKSTGGIQSPHDAWLTLNGLRTLPLRLKAQSQSAQELAEWLLSQREVRRVHYPSLGDARTQAIRARQHLGADGAVVTFELEADLAAAQEFVQALQVFALVEHVGSVDSLITHPASMTHADLSPAERRRAGVADGLLRLSVGLEPVAALKQDLSRAFAALVRKGRATVEAEA